jgi:DNA repair photolyase
MLGELYQPSGKALEHARAVLDLKDAHAVNVAYGCSMGCSYCYGPSATYQSLASWREVRYPKEKPIELVRRQLDKGLCPNGVFISFLTEPLLPGVRESTEDLAQFLVDQDIKVAISSKSGVAMVTGVRHGMTVVSTDAGFTHRFEGINPEPMMRVETLRAIHDSGEYTWASLEPLPCPAIWEQDILEVLQRLDFVDFLILGKWNYDVRSSTSEARAYYRDAVLAFRDFCAEHGIRHHIKTGTLRFIGGLS